MSIYAIGDIQGCFKELQILLTQIAFDPAHDQLWFTGDLVNRGPDSLEVLRFVKGLGSSAITVLGNHDLHCLAVAYGHGKHHKHDTLESIFTADDADQLLTWLRQRPLMHVDDQYQVALIHAGLAPEWDIATAKKCAEQLEQALQGGQYLQYFKNMYGNQPVKWSGELEGWDRLRFITNCFTRLRYLDADGHLSLKQKGRPGRQPNGHIPWFQSPNRASLSHTLLFGHWSTLGFYDSDNVVGLDTGCLWGGALTAVKLSTNETKVEQVFQLDCKGELKP